MAHSQEQMNICLHGYPFNSAGAKMQQPVPGSPADRDRRSGVKNGSRTRPDRIAGYLLANHDRYPG